MAAGEKCYQRLLDDLALAEDDLADALAHEAQALAEPFDLGDEIGRGRACLCGIGRSDRVHAETSLLTRGIAGESDGKLRAGKFIPDPSVRRATPPGRARR